MRNSKRSAARSGEPDSQLWQTWLAGPPPPAPPKHWTHWLVKAVIGLTLLAVLEVGAVVVMVGGMWLACDPAKGGC